MMMMMMSFHKFNCALHNMEFLQVVYPNFTLIGVVPL
jgi:hypothetical protein